MRTKKLVLSAMFAAVMCILGPIAVYIGSVPVSLGTFGLYLLAAFLPWKNALAAIMVYLLLGMAGLPVFSGFSGGLAKVAGPTGGYLIGYIPCVLILSIIVRKWKKLPAYFLGAVLGTIVCYGIGSLWFMLLMKTGIVETLIYCVLPFLPGDFLKILGAGLLVSSCRRKGIMIE